jgi:hypothetical protein
MQIDLEIERTIPLTQAAGHLPKGRADRAVSFSTVLRWVLRGARGPDGTRIRLEAVRLGGRWVTSIEAIQRFADALTPNLSTADGKGVRKATTRRQRACDAAARKLQEMGV